MQLSVVVPVYGCEPCLRELHQRLTVVLTDLVDSYELVLVDDCGPDKSWDVLEDLAAADPHVRALQLSRNFGQHAAITAGLAECSGDAAVIMDCDLQDPPEDIPRLLATAERGFDIVYGKRIARKEGSARRLFNRAYFQLLRWAGVIAHVGDYGTFSLISRPVIDAFLQVQDRDRHYLFILHWLGFRASEIEYEHRARFAGDSSYTLGRLLSHVMDGVFFQTTRLLRFIVYLGFAISLAGFMLALIFIQRRLTGTNVPGWTALAVLTTVLGGMILTSTGIASLYIGKVFEQVKGRPLYIVRRTSHGADIPPQPPPDVPPPHEPVPERSESHPV